MGWLGLVVALAILIPAVLYGVTAYSVKRSENWTKEGGLFR